MGLHRHDPNILDRSLFRATRAHVSRSLFHLVFLALLIPPGVALSLTVASIPNPLQAIRTTTESAAATLHTETASLANRFARAFGLWGGAAPQPGGNLTYVRPDDTPLIAVAALAASTSSQSATPLDTVDATLPHSKDRDTDITDASPASELVGRALLPANTGAVLGAATSVLDAVTHAELEAALNTFRSQFWSALSFSGPAASTPISVQAFAPSQRIDQLNNATLSNITVQGVSGLADADIPDGITASNYLPLTGGTLSGDFAVTGNFTVSGAQTLSGAITIPYLVATSSTASSFAGNLGVGTTTPWAQFSVNPNGISGPAFAIGSSTATNFVVTNAGMVGIGTASPSKTLDVTGDIQLSNILYFTRGGYTGSIYSNASGLYLGTSDTLTIRTSGNVGVGNISPTYKLDVTGNGHFTSLVDAANFVATSSSATSTFAGGITGPNNFTVQQTSGSVGIGTASPSQKLEVIGVIKGSSQLLLQTTAASYALEANGGGRFTNSSSGGNSGATIIDQAGGSGSSRIIQYDQNGSLPNLFNASGVSYITGGNLGIGSTTPWAKLSVTNTGSGPSFVVEDSTSPDSTPFIVDASGNVGIGTASPAKKMDVVGDVRASTGFYALNNTGYFMRDAGDTFDITLITLNASAQTVINNGNGQSVLINNSNAGNVLLANGGGSVGIGTTNPDNGKIEVKGGTVCVDTNSDDNASSCIASESDARLKQNIQTLDASASLDTLLKLNPVSFDWRTTDPEVLKHYPLIGRFASSTHSVGLIAQEVQPLFPLAIEHETVGDSEVQYFQLDYTKFIPLIISGVKELARRLDELVNTVASFARRFVSDEIVARNQLCVGDTCVTPAQFQAMIAAANAPPSGGATPFPQADDTPIPPVIEINGENPAHIHVGDSYADLGAIITAPEADKNLGIKTFFNGTLVSDIVIDTSEPETDTIDYVVTSSSGLTATSTRTVLIEALVPAIVADASTSTQTVAGSAAATSSIQ